MNMRSAMVLEGRGYFVRWYRERSWGGVCGWLANRRRIGRVIMEGVARMNDGHSVTDFLSRSMLEGQNCILPKSGGRTKVGCLHTMPNASMSRLSKEPNSIPLQLGLIELYAS